MKKLIKTLLLVSLVLLTACNEQDSSDQITFAISAEYPPFEYHKQGQIIGFDIDLAKLVAKELNKKAVFEDMQFSVILPALQSGKVDAAISTITITKDREKNFNFSIPYYTESLASVFKTQQPYNEASQLAGKKIAVQLGTTMEIWLKTHIPAATIIAMNNNNQVIEALKSGHVDAAVMDGAQGKMFSHNNPGLLFSIIAKADTGYGIALKKTSSLKPKIDQAIKKLQAEGKIEKLVKQWFGDK